VNQIKKLEINRLIKELDYIYSDFNYKSELIRTADEEFLSAVDYFLTNHPELQSIYDEKMNNKEVVEVVSHSEETSAVIINESNEEIQVLPEEPPKDPKLKTLYRAIVKSTHPDKAKDDNLKELYIEATSAYDTNNILPIFTICDKLRIPYEVTDEECNLIKNEIKSIRTKVNFMETTFTYQWWINQEKSFRNKLIVSYLERQITK
jgi:hypothetical protein